MKANFTLHHGLDLVGGGCVELNVWCPSPRAAIIGIEKGIRIVSGLRCKMEIQEEIKENKPGQKEVRVRERTKKQVNLQAPGRGYTTEPVASDFPSDDDGD